MRNLLSLLAIAALVGATTLAPLTSHAMPHGGAKVVQTEQAAKGHDCHGHGDAKDSQKTTQNDKDKDNCCDKGVCKCVGGTCHSGFSKIFGANGDVLFVFPTGKGVFGFENVFADSTFPDGLKRPPRA